jgi:hypothetical protein
MNSQAPELRLGSLLQHVELFMTYYFQGASLGRAISLRFGIIKARFFKALLAQLKAELDNEDAKFLNS